MIERRVFILGLCLVACPLVAAALGADGRLEQLPLTEAVGPQAPALEARGYRALRADGSTAADLWFAKNLSKLEDGVFLGVVHLADEGHDVRERALPSGTYTLRYAVLPAGDRHDACMPNPEFVVLLRATHDTDLGRRLAYDEMMTMSAQVLGSRHPVVWQVRRGRGNGSAAAFYEEPNGPSWMTVPLVVGEARVSLSLYLRGSLSR